jgi:hypothetical protein
LSRQAKFFTGEDFPDLNQKNSLSEFFKDANYNSSIIFLILQELRGVDSELLTNEQCRSRLAKLQSYRMMIDLPFSVRNMQEKEIEPKDELPEDY